MTPARIDFHRHFEGSHTARALLVVAEQFDIKDALFFEGGRLVSEDTLAARLLIPGPPGEPALSTLRSKPRAART